ncbi:MAG: phosphoglycerate dehydrogenase [Dehalococcoidia bacterium]
MNRILITTSAFGKDDVSPLDLLRKAGCRATTNPYGRKLTEDELLGLLSEVEPVGLIAGVEPITARVLQQAKGLKAISRCGAGLENVDLDAAGRLGITVTNTPDAPTQAVAELTIALILDLLRRVSFLDRELRKGNWMKETGTLLRDKTVGIVGLGRIGRRVAEMLLGLGAKIAGTDIQPDYGWLQKNHVPLLDLNELLKQSEILCLHVSYTAGCRHLIGRKEMEAMPEGACLVNVSRGEVIDHDVLYSMLTSGHLAGAALDVFDREPYTGPLTKLDNVVLTPHVGSYAREARLEMETQAVENLLRALNLHKDNEADESSSRP